MTNDIKKKILKHLSAQPDSWSSTISKVCTETMAGRMFVEKAMKEMVESREIERCSDGNIPQYQAPGAAEGKYADFNTKRLEGMENPTTSSGFEDDPRKKTLSPDTAV